MKKKIRSNRKMKAKRRAPAKGGVRAGRWVKSAGGLAAVAVMSAFFIFCHDLITQSDVFKAEQVSIVGCERLTEAEIMAWTQIQSGVNVLGVNLAQARKRLLAHPWIAEAELSREIPPRIVIRITEHRPLAVIDLGRKFLINEKGVIFKEMGAHDPTNLPVVHGLRFSDISIPDPPPTQRARSEAVASAGPKNPKSMLGSLYDTVVAVLNLGLQNHGAISDWTIKTIHVDRELGLTLVTADRQTAIKLGFNEFSAKYELLQRIIDFLNQGLVLKTRDVGSIDLKNLNRIVLNPIQKGGTSDG